MSLESQSSVCFGFVTIPARRGAKMRFQLLQWWFWSATTRVARAFAPSMRRWRTHAFASCVALTPSPRRLCNLRAARTAAEEQELLLTEPAVNAFIVAEVEAFVRERSYASEDQEAVTSDDVALISEATRAAYRAADAADVMGSLSTGLAFLRPRFEGADLEGPLHAPACRRISLHITSRTCTITDAFAGPQPKH